MTKAEPMKNPFQRLTELFSKDKDKGKDKKPDPAKAPPVLHCLFFILDWERRNELSDVLTAANVRFQMSVRGRGTASSEMLDMLGLSASEKAVVICLEQEQMAAGLFREVSRQMGFYRPGAGIAFDVPLSGVNTPLLKAFKASVQKDIQNLSHNILDIPDDDSDYHCILAIAHQGWCDELMTAARKAGAGGGTVINARGLLSDGPAKFFGISVQKEREIIIILADREKKTAIMDAVQKFCTEEERQSVDLMMSLPVNMTMGIRRR
jgi:hypothetical protein